MCATAWRSTGFGILAEALVGGEIFGEVLKQLFGSLRDEVIQIVRLEPLFVLCGQRMVTH